MMFILTRSWLPSAFVAAVFAIHPMHVESVAWVAERKDVLSGLFWCLTILAYGQWVQTRRIVWYASSLLACALGLMAKPMLVTMPFVLLLLDFWPLGRVANLRPEQSKPPANGHPWTRLLVEKVPFFVFSILSSAITLIGQKEAGGVVETAAIPMTSRLLNAVIAYGTYLLKFVWPTNLSVFYPYPDTFPLWKVVLSIAVLAGITAVAVYRWRTMPWIVTGWFWFLGTLVPVIGIVQVSERAMADRFAYIPYIGLYIVVAWTVPTLLPHRPRYGRVIGMFAVAICSAFALTAHAQVRHWQDSVTLFNQAINATTRNYIAHINLGEALQARGKTEDAVRQYRLALEIKPHHPKAHNNLGVSLVKQNRLDEAIGHYRSAIASKPDHETAHHNLGLAYFRKKDTKQAIPHYEKAVQLKPDYAEARVNLGLALVAENRLDEALNQFRQATVINPRLHQAYYGWGLALERQGKKAEAITQFKHAVTLNPQFDSAVRAVNRLQEKGGGSNR
jgi:Tfp pilus assembly protein PilF